VELRPLYFVAENVEGLLQGYGVRIVERFCRIVSKGGYSVVSPIQVLDAADLGVPQRRRRTIILGHRNRLAAPRYPARKGLIDHRGREYFPTVRDAIGDLPDVDKHDSLFTTDQYSGRLRTASCYARMLRESSPHARLEARTSETALTGCFRTRHSAATTWRFRRTPPGGSEPVSRYIRLALDEVAPTIRAGTASDKGSHTAPRPIHPVKPRCITVREAARLHSFPDWFQFHATRWHAFRQIGNAVPPQMAKAVAAQVLSQLVR
jgi:DNA (cytosine-5)-methyltransferase 1